MTHPSEIQKGLDLTNLPLATVMRILKPAFDPAYYSFRYQEFGAEEPALLKHYCETGWRELRDPSPNFSTGGYLAVNPDVASHEINPLLHYIVYGQREGRTAPRAAPQPGSSSMPGPAKAEDRDTRQTAAEMDALRGYFDMRFYADTYADMRVPSVNALEHYCVFGWKEGRDPCASFSTRRYLQMHRDVARLGVNPYYHYITLGRTEGRATQPSGLAGSVELAVDAEAVLVTDPALRDLIRFPPRAPRPSSRKYNPRRLMIDWVVPDFDVGSGGHMTLFRLIRWLEIFGHTCRIWLSHLSTHVDAAEAYGDIVKHFQTLRAEVRLAEDGLADCAGDALVATGWQTVARVMNAIGYRERCYLVQDLEPNFYPTGSHSLAAEWTYTQDLACICASPWLAETLSSQFGRWSRHFALAYDPEHYHPRKVAAEPDGELSIAVYGRITTPRRCVELVLLALEHLASQGIVFTVHLFGAMFDAPAANFRCVVHGIVDAAVLGSIYRRCGIGICFSATNYSLVPQEMMACGLPVLEIDSASTRAIFPDSVVARVEAHPLEISAAVGQLLASPERRVRQVAAAAKWIDGLSWEASARSVEQAILERFAEADYLPGTSRARKRPAARSRPYVSVCIPTLNGGERFISVVESIERQRCVWEFEIIIVDSGSLDGSIDSLPSSPRLIVETIRQEDFQHGRTRNQCAGMARGDFVAFLTQDACPADEFWLYNLVTTLEHFPNGAGAFGRHVAWPDASPFIKRDIAGHFDSFAQYPLAVSRETDAARWANGDQGWREMLHFFSDNNSCLRRSVWERYPYPEVDYGEDQVWANEVISAGLERIYAPDAVVYHSHDYPPAELEKRMATEARFFKQYFGYDRFDSSKPFEAQLLSKNAEDERWARANNIDADALDRRFRENEAWLRGLRKGTAG